MGAAHTADDNLVSSFFIRSIKRRGGLSLPAVEITFL